MPMTDVFQSDAFSAVNLTAAVQKLPFRPSLVTQLGLFEPNGISTTNAVVEELDGEIRLLRSAPRGKTQLQGGGPPNQNKGEKRKVRSFVVPHFPYEDSISADDVQGLRAFGSETEQDMAEAVVNRRLQRMVQDHETTREFLQVGAIRGQILDGDKTSVLLDLHTEFDVAQPVVEFNLDSETTSVKKKAEDVIEAIEGALGAANFGTPIALCGRDFWRSLISHPDMSKAFDRWEQGQFLRQDPRLPLDAFGINWLRYRGGAVDMIPADEAFFIPTGVPDLMQINFAPAAMWDSVNTIGQPVYAKLEMQRFGMGVDIHTQSNPLPLVTRPAAIVRGFETEAAT